jgi:endonuclease YncB( thermonuclease family)
MILAALAFTVSLASAQTATATATKVPTLTPTPVFAELYDGKVLRIIDGDTVEVELACGFGYFLRDKVRLHGINAPELPTTAGVAAKQRLEELLRSDYCTMGSGGNMRFRSFKDKRDKYGRLLLDLQCNSYFDPATGIERWISVSDQMVKDGFAVFVNY